MNIIALKIPALELLSIKNGVLMYSLFNIFFLLSNLALADNILHRDDLLNNQKGISNIERISTKNIGITGYTDSITLDTNGKKVKIFLSIGSDNGVDLNNISIWINNPTPNLIQKAAILEVAYGLIKSCSNYSPNEIIILKKSVNSDSWENPNTLKTISFKSFEVSWGAGSNFIISGKQRSGIALFWSDTKCQV